MSAVRGAEGAARLAALGALLLFAPGLSAQAPPQALRNPIETLVLSPEPGERILQDAVLVAASFIDRDARIDAASIRLEVDGRDVTAEAQVSAEVVTWTPRQPLNPGPHRAVLTARDRSGAPISPTSWAFSVAPGFEGSPAAANLEPGSGAGFAKLQGSITFEGSGRSVSGAGAGLLRDEKQLPRVWVSAGGLLVAGWRYSARMHVSGYESKDRQPVNRFRFDIRSNHLSASVGDVNPMLHDLIMAGTRVRGAQADIKAGPARLTVLKGNSRREIPGMLNPTNTSQILRSGTYGQSVLGIRPSLGGESFQIGATVLRVKDDTASIPDLRLVGVGGTTQRVNPTPKDNLVMGTDVTVRILSSRVLLQYQNAFSLLANDITGGALTEAQLDSIMEAAGYDPLDVDPSQFEEYFTINASMIPLDPRGLTSLAQQARASLRVGSNILTGEWRSIGGSYYTLGYPALIRDRRGFRIRDSFTILNDALALAGGFETDEDNLDAVKPATTTNTAAYAQASWQAAPRSASLVASVRKGSRTNNLAAAATGAQDESTTALSLGVGLPIAQVGAFHTRLNLNASAVARTDPSNTTVNSRDRYYLAGFQGETDTRASSYNVMYGLNTTSLTAIANAKTDFHRAVANVRYRVAPRVTATLDGTVTAARSPEGAGDLALEYDRRELLAGGEYEWTAASFVTLNAGVVSYADQRFPTRNTRELVTRIVLHRAF